MKILGLALAAFVALAAPALAQPSRSPADPWYTQAPDFAPTERVAVVVRNSLNAARHNNPVTITRAQLSALPDVHEFAITLVDPTAPSRPAPTPDEVRLQGGHLTGAETNGGWIPYQLDDLDGDGQWDELFFQADLGARQTKTFYLYIGFQNQGWYAHRTHAGIGSYARHEVPFWESESIGWKLWFPTDIDVWAKRAPVLIAQHIYMENLDGYGLTLHDPAWGSDIMQVSNTFGGGGIGLFEDGTHPDVISRPRFTPGGPWATNFNAGPAHDTRYSFSVITNGPLRSMIRARTMNWNSGAGQYEVEQLYTVYGGENYATSRVTFSGFSPAHADTTFAAGIRKHINESVFYQRGGVVISGAPEGILNPDDADISRTSLIVDFIGSAMVIRDAYHPRYVYSPGFGGNHAFSIAPNAQRSFEYLIAAAWSEGQSLKTPAEFQDYVLRTAREYNAPITLVAQNLQTRPNAANPANPSNP